MASQPFRKLSISVPESMALQMEQVAAQEARTMSELVRESFRAYTAQQIRKRFEAGHEYAKRRNPRQYKEADVPRLVKEVRKQSAGQRKSE